MAHDVSADTSEGRERQPSGESPERIDRRHFLTYGAAAGALAAAAPLASTEALASTRRHRFPFKEATISDIQRDMAAGRVTSHRLVKAYIERIDRLDFRGPRLNSIIETNPDALAIADRLDRERAAGHVRGPLHGIPILLKDNIATADRMETTAGSLALLGSVVPRDAFVARRLRAAGAVLLGKTNLSEWANFRSSQSSSGWSGRAGQCLNPYVLDHNPCGSSSGSGAAVSANLAMAALGTETDGSIVCPSSINGIVGLKPTVGLASRAGIVPISHNQDTAGPMCRSVADVAIVLGALTGVDARDPATRRSRGHVARDYRRFLDPDGLRGARIGVWREGGFGASEETDQIMEAALSDLSRLGAKVIDPANVPHADELGDPEFTVLLFDFKHDLNEYLSELRRSQVRTLAQTIAFNKAHAAEEMPFFGQDIFELAQQSGPLSDPTYKQALATCHRLARREGINAVMRRHDLDAIVAPTASPSWTTDLINGDHFLLGSSSPAAVAGFPNITVPAGFSFGLPVGISFFGRAWSEPKLIRLASGFEHGTRVRKPPRFRATVGTRDFEPRGIARTVSRREAPARTSASPRKPATL